MAAWRGAEKWGDGLPRMELAANAGPQGARSNTRAAGGGSGGGPLRSPCAAGAVLAGIIGLQSIQTG